MVTVMSPDGKPILVNASALQQTAGIQKGTGMNQNVGRVGYKCKNRQELSISSKVTHIFVGAIT